MPTSAHVLVAVAGLWALLGLIVDGWSHNTQPELESFWTPWHALFYSGFTATAAAVGWVLVRSGRSGSSWRARAPLGYDHALVGVCVFALGGIGDAAWHRLFGVEVGIEALMSPTHTALIVGLAMVLVAPTRHLWLSGASLASLRERVAATLSLGSALAVGGFYFQYLSPHWRAPAGTRFEAIVDDAAAGSDLAGTTLATVSTAMGVGGVLFSVAIYGSLVIVIGCRWRTFAGFYTVLFGMPALLMSAMTAFSVVATVPAAVLAGAVCDVLTLRAQRAAPGPVGLYRSRCRVVVPLAVWWAAYFVLLEAIEGVYWTTELTVGSVALAAVFAAGLVELFSVVSRAVLAD